MFEIKTPLIQIKLSALTFKHVGYASLQKVSSVSLPVEEKLILKSEVV